MTQCQTITGKGERCAGTAGEGSSYCWHHSPEHAAERQRIASRAAKAQRKVPTPGQLAAQIQRVMDDLSAGRIGRDEATAQAQLLNAMRGAIKLDLEIRRSDFEERLRAIEDRLGGYGPRPSREKRF